VLGWSCADARCCRASLCIAVDCVSKDANSFEASDLVSKRKALCERFVTFANRQKRLVPLLLDQVHNVGPAETIEHRPLYLPSAFSAQAQLALFSPALWNTETELCYAAMADSLERLKDHLAGRSFLNRFKVTNVRGQWASTRIRTNMKGVDDRPAAATAQYCRHRAAYFVLASPSDWEKTYCVLEKSDVRGFNKRGLNEQEERNVAHHARLAAQLRANGLIVEEAVEDSIKGGTRVMFGASQLGKGWRGLSWIWTYSSLRQDAWENNPEAIKGVHACAFCNQQLLTAG
jgi:hypothetical protein